MCVPRTLVAVVFLFCIASALAKHGPHGGMFKADTGSKEVVQAAQFATQTLNLYYSREPAAFKVVRVVSAEKQVVAGTNYDLKVVIGLTQCGKNVPSWVLNFCPLQFYRKPLLCKFEVTVLWHHRMALSAANCFPTWSW